MKSRVRSFDSKTSLIIARLPEATVKPFHWLGYATMPAAWFGYISLYLLIIDSSNPVTRKFGIVCLLLLPIASLLKYLFRRQRPGTIYAGSMRVKSYSFPSSHAYSAVIGSGYFAVQVSQQQNLVAITLLGLLALTIGISRVRLGAHYPSDVLSGWLLGLVLLAASYLLISS